MTRNSSGLDRRGSLLEDFGKLSSLRNEDVPFSCLCTFSPTPWSARKSNCHVATMNRRTELLENTERRGENSLIPEPSNSAPPTTSLQPDLPREVTNVGACHSSLGFLLRVVESGASSRTCPLWWNNTGLNALPFPLRLPFALLLRTLCSPVGPGLFLLF